MTLIPGIRLLESIVLTAIRKQRIWLADRIGCPPCNTREPDNGCGRIPKCSDDFPPDRPTQKRNIAATDRQIETPLKVADGGRCHSAAEVEASGSRRGAAGVASAQAQHAKPQEEQKRHVRLWNLREADHGREIVLASS